MPFAAIFKKNTAAMFNIVLVEPEIAPNTGNVIRLAANTDCALHLAQPLGFALDGAKLRRAGGARGCVGACVNAGLAKLFFA